MGYDIHEDIKYAALERIDAGALADACTVPWWNQSLCRVNDSVARIGVFHGEFHWHKHDREDELFFCIDGTLFVDLEGKSVELGPRQGLELVCAEIVAGQLAPDSWLKYMICQQNRLPGWEVA